jgi:hypothetical protein
MSWGATHFPTSPSGLAFSMLPRQEDDWLLPLASRSGALSLGAGRTKHGDGVAAGEIHRHAVHGDDINLLADAVKLDGDVIIDAGNS